MLLTTQQWFGTTWTTSPTFGRSAHAERSTTPCSSERLRDDRLRILHDVAVALHAVLIRGEHLRARIEDGAPVGGRLTTVARTRMAQLSQVAVPDATTMASLNTQVPARCSVSIGMFCAVKMAGVPPPDTTGTGMPAALEQRQRPLEELARGRARDWGTS